MRFVELSLENFGAYGAKQTFTLMGKTQKKYYFNWRKEWLWKDHFSRLLVYRFIWKANSTNS